MNIINSLSNIYRNRFDAMYEMLFGSSMQFQIGYLWIVIGLAFLFAEMGTPGLFFFISFAIGCLFASITAFMGHTLTMQCIVGLVASIGALLIMRSTFAGRKQGQHKTNIQRLIHKEGFVTKVIDPKHIGQVRVGREEWPAKIESDIVLQVGTKIKVIKVVGNKLIVK